MLRKLAQRVRELAQRVWQWCWRVRCRCGWAVIGDGEGPERLRRLERARVDRWF